MKEPKMGAKGYVNRSSYLILNISTDNSGDFSRRGVATTK